MPIFHKEIDQNTEEWLEIRRAKITGSTHQPLLVSGRQEKGFGAGAMTLLYKLLEECLTDELQPNFGGNKATEFGHENEDLGREYYELQTFEILDSVGFVEKNEWIGTSPDRLIRGKKEGVEFKCLPKKHIQIVETGEYDKSHYSQCQWNMWVCEYEAWNLVYFHPKMPEKAKMKVFRFEPDLKLWAQFDDRSQAMIDLVKERLKKYK